ncbi:MAG: FAD-binding oxidoreductase [Deltaproteobacteria bacterium]|nr:FAD-binding oxidoreductase [Deltaproteobacteria bacterium]
MIEIDPISLLVTADTDLSVAALEEKVAAEGYTLNYFALPDNRALLAEALSRRLPNLYAAAFGGIDDLCLQLKLAQAGGALYANVKTPRSAAGPGLKKMAIGSGEWLGLPIQATLRIFPKPAHRECRAYAFAQERDLEAFEKSLLKLRWPLPLRARLVSEEAMQVLDGLSLLDRAVAISWWGPEGWMRSYGEALEDLALGKQGRALGFKSGRDEGDLDALLRRAAIAAALERSERRLQELPESHRSLASFLKEGA